MPAGSFHLTTAVTLYIIYVHQVTCVSRPLGPKLCERICLKTAGCWNYIFLTHDLHCDVTGTREKGKHFFYANVTRKTRKLNPPCDSGLPIILTKRGQLKCEFTRGQLNGKCSINLINECSFSCDRYKRVQKSQYRFLQRSHYRKERVLFVTYQTPTRDLYFYYPANRSVQTVTLKFTGQFLGIADISASEVLLYDHTKHLMILNVQKRHTNIIKRRILIIDMATGNMCVYILVGLSNNTQKLKVVESTFIDRHRVWSVNDLTFLVAHCSKLEYDPQNSVLYLLCGSNVQRIDLKSRLHTILTDWLSAENIAVDGRNGLLYYSFESTVSYVNITDNSHKIDFQIGSDIDGFVYCDGKFFISRRIPDGWIYEYGESFAHLCQIPNKPKILIA